VLGPRLADEFGLSAAQLGLLTGAFFASFVAVQVPLGMALDRFGPRRVDGTLLVLAGAGALLFASASGFEGLLAGRIVSGIGVSAAMMGTMQAFALWYPRDRLASLLALAFAVGGIGMLATSFPLEYALRTLSWRDVFYALAGVSLALGAAFAFWVPERTAPARPETLAAQLAGLAQIARDPGFRRAALALAANQLAVMTLLNLWVATWLRDVAGFDRTQVAWTLALLAVAMMAGYLVLGPLTDRVARRGGSELSVLGGALAGTLALLVPLALGVTTGAVLLWALFVFCGTGGTLTHTIAMRRFPLEMAGRVNTLLNLSGFIAMFAGQWGFGVVLGLWPGAASGYAPQAYTAAMAAQWLALAAALGWLWRGRALFASARTD